MNPETTVFLLFLALAMATFILFFRGDYLQEQNIKKNLIIQNLVHDRREKMDCFKWSDSKSNCHDIRLNCIFDSATGQNACDVYLNDGSVQHVEY